MILVGELALWIALLMAAWGAIVSFAGARTHRVDLVASGERALFATFACLVLATAGLFVALVTSDFSFAYVASFTTANLPVGYKVTALWAGRAGALLLWTLFLSMCAALAAATNQTQNRPVMPYVVGTLSTVLLFFLAVMCLRTSPYERIAPIPPEGRGLPPELQNPAMALYEPSLFLGYVAAAIPFAFAIGALFGRRIDAEWASTVQRWTTISWCFLSIGIITGLWWTYAEPGRHAGWVWEPIRSWAIFPWLGVAIAGHLVARQRDGRRTSGRGQPAMSHTRVRTGTSLAVGGAIVFGIALAGTLFSQQRDVALGPGEAATLVDPFGRRWTFTSQGVSDFPELNRAVEAVALRATRDGTPHGLISSERRQYVDSRGAPTFDPALESGIDHSLLQDTYVVLMNVVADRVDVRIAFHPLRMWVWIGGIAIAVGGSLVMWPGAALRQGQV